MRSRVAIEVVIAFAVIVLAGLLNDAQCADWKYLGSGNDSTNKVTVGFYDTESVEYKSGGDVRAWIKFIAESEINRMMKNKQKQIVEKSSEKLATGYFPPYVLASPDTSQDSYIAILSLEEVANIYETKTQAVVFYEMKCKDK